jgi:hypothetical protein
MTCRSGTRPVIKRAKETAAGSRLQIGGPMSGRTVTRDASQRPRHYVSLATLLPALAVVSGVGCRTGQPSAQKSQRPEWS